ncbi:hypothetical protein [Streptomyces paradoxus]|uniref:hypothetical protein n=1 Tax=Streptomyces paradoxus TaxID=66375 RepID=UPI00381D2D70
MYVSESADDDHADEHEHEHEQEQQQSVRFCGGPDVRKLSDTDDGFVVDHSQDEVPLLVACRIERGTAVQRDLRRYRQALTQAGMQVGRHSKDRNTVLVWMPDTTA